MKPSYKIIWIISLVLSFVLGYYFPSQTTDKLVTSTLEVKEQCMRVGSEVHTKIVAEYKKSDYEASVFKPEYTYNPRLDTCLYFSGAVSRTEDGKLTVQKWVVNSFTNEELLSFMSFDDQDVGMSLDYFDAQKERLFTEVQ